MKKEVNQNTNRQKMKLWKKIIIAIFIFYFIKMFITIMNFPAISAKEVNEIISNNRSLSSENEKLKEENISLKAELEQIKSLSLANENNTKEITDDKTLMSLMLNSSKANKNTNVSDKSTSTSNTTQSDIPREYKNALKSAKNYISMIPFSKARLYDQLTSDAGEKYSPEAGQYAIDNLNVNYKEQALKAAKNYLSMMPMSDAQLKEQLISDAGEKFTEEEAQYAIDNLDK